ncbi:MULTISPECIES: ABC transporter ATP-binding protein [Protofrankia]|uniref:Sugar ABC transporter n=1 Tax=Protofrankia coriariae TaxID=1562887 RepID=A0ABR5F3E5_9ACTN|nr:MULTISPECIES: ABC transporter ATP-binding protein [Protofrankia]KLL11212.1 sugar ABC transporter [Protofrankia coriariae]ONH31806.1 ABC transporter ATP-binding protein [Protofrankia sp. BMG5.30]
MTALTITGVTKSYGGTPVLQGVDLHVPQGSLTAVLGPSGCGKTTLLRVIAGFADPDGGTVAFGNEIVFRPGRSTKAQHRKVGYVPQEGALFPHLTVTANITFGLPRTQRKQGSRVAELLELVGLAAELSDRYPYELSGGQQQRVALARALAPRPAVVLLDEPFSALDAGLREATRRGVTRALRAAGTTAVLVTHDQAEALSLADQVGVMRQGRLVQLDTPATVYSQPRDVDVAGFVGEAVLLPATIHDGQAWCALGTIPVTDSEHRGDAQVLIRPEQLRIHTTDRPNGVTARVREINYYGHDATIRLDLLPEGPSVVARVVAGQRLPGPHTDVQLTVSGNAVTYPATR